MRSSALALSLCALIAARVFLPLTEVCAQSAPPYDSSPAYGYPEARDQVRVQKQAEQQARRAAKQAARAAAAARLAKHRAEHRVFSYVGFSPVLLVDRRRRDGQFQRLRQRTVTLAAGYRHALSARAGIYAGMGIGLGPTYLTLAEGGLLRYLCCETRSQKTSLSFAYDMDVGLTFGPFRHVFLQPGLDVRLLRLPDARADFLEREGQQDELVGTVRYAATQALVGGRLSFGVLFGERDQYEFALAGDAGRNVSNSGRYLGLTARMGVALQDLFEH